MATVDILMATYNGERYIREQIESIRSQSFTDWRLLISDDCSTDNTLSIINRYAAIDERINVVSEGRRYGGAKENFFSLMHYAESPYVMFCDQDDVWLANKVSKSLEAIVRLEKTYSCNKPLLVYCDMKVVDSRLNIINESFERLCNYDPYRVAFKHLLTQNVIPGCAMLVNKPAMHCAYITHDVSDIEMHDWWIALIAAAFGEIYFIDESLSLYRQHGKNELGAKKYSPLERANNQVNMLRSFKSSVAQAKCFEEIFGKRVCPDDDRALKALLRAESADSILEGLIWLVRSGCWKKGARKIGQLVMVAKNALINSNAEADS